MKGVTLTSRVGPDGVLRVNVPIGVADANREVTLTVEPVAAKRPMTQDEWRRWVQAMAGCIPDATFRRHEQGDYEQREQVP